MHHPLRTVVGHCGLLILLGIGFGLLAFAGAHSIHNNDVDKCHTPACHRAVAADVLMSNMDTSVDPCDNFYDYACGAWIQNTVIPAHKGSEEQYSIAKENLREAIKEIITNISRGDSPVFRKPQMFYRSCMDTDTIESRGDQPLRAYLRELGGWPMIDSTWTADNFDLTGTLVKIRQTFGSRLFYFDLWEDLNNVSTYALTVHQPFGYTLGAREAYYTNKTATKLAAIKKAVRAVVAEMGGQTSVNDKDIDDVYNFEAQLAELANPWTVEMNKDPSEWNNRYTVQRMDAEFPMINWRSYFRGLFQNDEVGITIPDNEPVVNYVPHYFRKLNAFIEKADRKTLANYLMCRVVLDKLSQLSSKYRQIYLELQTVLTGQKELPEKSETCLDISMGTFGLVLGNKYVTEYLQSSTKAEVEEMLVELKEAFNQRFDDIAWMDAEAKQKAKEKNNEMGSVVAYADEILDIDFVTKRYEHCHMEEDKYFENRNNISRDDTNSLFKQLRKFQDRLKVDVNPLVVNAMYSIFTNVMQINAGILQSTFYNAAYPSYMKYAGIGEVIGHEISHGFDSVGRRFGKHGKPEDWWTNATHAEYTRRQKCFVNQYNNYVSPEANSSVNGEATLQENIADAGAIRQTFRAYKNWVKTKNDGVEEKPLPRLGKNIDQLFFISYAQSYCSKIRPELAQKLIESDPHAPNRFRLIGALQNFDEFAKAFECSYRSYMNPRTKCVIW